MSISDLPGSGQDNRRAAVLGSPIAHSRSPQLHLAAYRVLGLTGWTYERIECTAEQLPPLVRGLGPEWVGLSVTMPGKFAALSVADSRTRRAELAGSANTLVRVDGGWRADNTDVDGVAGALRSVFRGERSDGEIDGPAAVLGSGGTAPAAVVALAQLGVPELVIVARNPDKARVLVELAERLGVPGRWIRLGSPLPDLAAMVSTLPAQVAGEYAGTVEQVPVLLDAIYDPWPTPLARTVSAAGGRVISGLEMLLHQAYAQVEQFTGLPAPKAAMAAALEQAGQDSQASQDD